MLSANKGPEQALAPGMQKQNVSCEKEKHAEQQIVLYLEDTTDSVNSPSNIKRFREW